MSSAISARSSASSATSVAPRSDVATDGSGEAPGRAPRSASGSVSSIAPIGTFLSEIFLVAVFGIALAVRVATVAHPADIYLGAAILFDHLGLRVAVGHGFGPTAVLPPLYPFYLSMFYERIGYSHEIVLFSHALLGALSCAAGALLVRYLGLSRRYAWFAGLILALSPQAIAQTRHLSPEILLAYLFIVGMVLWVRGRPFPHFAESLGAGGAFGLVILGGLGSILPIGFAILSRVPFANRIRGVFGVRKRGPHRRLSTWSGIPKWMLARALHVVLALGMVTAIGGAWAARNTEVHDRLVLVDSTWALRLRSATIPGSHEIDYRAPGRRVLQPDNSTLTENAVALGDWMGFVISHPGIALRIWLGRVGLFFGFSGLNDSVTFEQFPYTGTYYQLAQALVWGAILSLALGWAILLRCRGGQERVLASTVLGCIALASISGNVGFARLLAFPLVVALAMRGAWGILVLSGIRLRTPRIEAEMIANRERLGVELLPVGVVCSGKLRWTAWAFAVGSVWVHGLASILR